MLRTSRVASAVASGVERKLLRALGAVAGVPFPLQPALAVTSFHTSRARRAACSNAQDCASTCVDMGAQHTLAGRPSISTLVVGALTKSAPRRAAPPHSHYRCCGPRRQLRRWVPSLAFRSLCALQHEGPELLMAQRVQAEAPPAPPAPHPLPPAVLRLLLPPPHPAALRELPPRREAGPPPRSLRASLRAARRGSSAEPIANMGGGTRDAINKRRQAEVAQPKTPQSGSAPTFSGDHAK